jgi:hypothetical protein
VQRKSSGNIGYQEVKYRYEILFSIESSEKARGSKGIEGGISTHDFSRLFLLFSHKILIEDA